MSIPFAGAVVHTAGPCRSQDAVLDAVTCPGTLIVGTSGTLVVLSSMMLLGLSLCPNGIICNWWSALQRLHPLLSTVDTKKPDVLTPRSR